MDHKALTIEEIRELIKQGDASDPLVFLEAIMNGQDIRTYSRVYQLVQEIEDFDDDPPTPEEWEELKKEIKDVHRYAVTSIKESVNAAKILSEYLHPKLKSLQINGSLDGHHTFDLKLSEEEIELFKEKFNESF